MSFLSIFLNLYSQSENLFTPEFHPFSFFLAEAVHFTLVFRVGQIPFGGIEIVLQCFVFEDVSAVGEGQILQYAALLGGGDSVVVVFVVGSVKFGGKDQVAAKSSQNLGIEKILFFKNKKELFRKFSE